jgi:hypothetical protein
MLPWLTLPYTATHLGFEAQKAAFRLLGLGGGITKRGAHEIVNVPPADTPPSQVAVPRKTRHAAPKTRQAAKRIHKKSAAVRKRGKRAKRG